MYYADDSAIFATLMLSGHFHFRQLSPLALIRLAPITPAARRIALPLKAGCQRLPALSAAASAIALPLISPPPPPAAAAQPMAAPPHAQLSELSQRQPPRPRCRQPAMSMMIRAPQIFSPAARPPPPARRHDYAAASAILAATPAPRPLIADAASRCHASGCRFRRQPTATPLTGY